MENIVKQILINENISFNNVTKATSGFTNAVYFVDDKYVVKISKNDITNKKLEKETSIYKNVNVANMPKYVASGTYNNNNYLIITKLKGCGLYSVWHTLTVEQKNSVIKQIANILKGFNNSNYAFLGEEYKHLNWQNYMLQELTKRSDSLKELGFNTSKLDNFLLNNLENLFNENTYGLVYNDAHFDNFIYNNDTVSLIDFDRVIVCPIDYEMLIFKTMCDNPLKFVSEEDEDKIYVEDFVDVYQKFKQEYPQMFNNDAENRIKVYQFNYLINQAIKCKDYNWITSLLNNF